MKTLVPNEICSYNGNKYDFNLPLCAVQGQKEENGDFFPFTRLVTESETTPRSARIIGVMQTSRK